MELINSCRFLTESTLQFLHRGSTNIQIMLKISQVELIGDAYMVVSGAPEPIASHAERIANTALGMNIVSRQVMSPYDYGDKSTSVKVDISFKGIISQNTLQEEHSLQTGP